MKSFKEFKGNISEAPENDPKEYDYEGEMAKNDMHIITMHAQHIADMLEDETNMPEWCQSKITIAKDYLQTVCDYLHAEMNEEAEHIDEISGDLALKYKNKALGGKSIDDVSPKRQKGVTLAHRKVSQSITNVPGRHAKVAATWKEESEHIDEKIKVKVSTNKPIGFKVADIGPGKKEYNVKTDKVWDDQNKKNHQKEESEQIDELSKDTLGSYVKKATGAKEKNWQYADAAAKRSKTAADTKQFLKHSEKFGKRIAGIKKAADKMGTEEE